MIVAPKGPIVKRPRQTMRCLLKNVRASVSVCVCLCLSVCHADDVHHHPSVPSSIQLIDLHPTQHPRLKVRRINNGMLAETGRWVYLSIAWTKDRRQGWSPCVNSIQLKSQHQSVLIPIGPFGATSPCGCNLVMVSVIKTLVTTFFGRLLK